MASKRKAKKTTLLNSSALRLSAAGAALLLVGLGGGLLLGHWLGGSNAVPEAAIPNVPAPRISTRPTEPVWPTIGTQPPASPQTPTATVPEQRPIEAPPVVAVPPKVPVPKAATPSVPRTIPANLPPRPEGVPPWQHYAVASVAPEGRPLIAIVIDDMGLDRKRSALAAALPGPINLSYLPYAEDLPAQTAAARARGHELMVHMPMEPINPREDAGPGALKIGLSLPEITSRLDAGLARFDGFVGVNNHMGSKFTAYPEGMAAVMAELRARGLLWLDSRTAAGSVAMTVAHDYGVPSSERDVFLDNNPTIASVNLQLTQLEAIAQKRGWAVAIGHPKDATVAALAVWLPQAGKRGFTIVPLSQIIRMGHPAG